MPNTSELATSDTGDPFFTSNTFVNDRRDALQPFSVGPRSCLGKNLAWAELRLFLALLVYEFDISPVAGKEPIAWEEQRCWNQSVREPFRVTLTRVHAKLS